MTGAKRRKSPVEEEVHLSGKELRAFLRLAARMSEMAARRERTALLSRSTNRSSWGSCGKGRRGRG